MLKLFFCDGHDNCRLARARSSHPERPRRSRLLGGKAESVIFELAIIEQIYLMKFETLILPVHVRAAIGDRACMRRITAI